MGSATNVTSDLSKSGICDLGSWEHQKERTKPLTGIARQQRNTYYNSTTTSHPSNPYYVNRSSPRYVLHSRTRTYCTVACFSLGFPHPPSSSSNAPAGPRPSGRREGREKQSFRTPSRRNDDLENESGARGRRGGSVEQVTPHRDRVGDGTSVLPDMSSITEDPSRRCFSSLCFHPAGSVWCLRWHVVCHTGAAHDRASCVLLKSTVKT